MKSFLRFILPSFVLFLMTASSVSAADFMISFEYNAQSGFLNFTTAGNTVEINELQNTSPIEFYQDEERGPFFIVFTDNSGEEIVKKYFDPGNESKYLLQTPYYSFAKKIDIYRTDPEALILTYDLSSFSKCNQNSVCEIERGESNDTCLADCMGSTVQYSQETQKKLEESNGIIRDPQTGNILLNNIPVEVNQDAPAQSSDIPTQKSSTLVIVVLSILFLIVMGGVVYYIVKKW